MSLNHLLADNPFRQNQNVEVNDMIVEGNLLLKNQLLSPIEYFAYIVGGDKQNNTFYQVFASGSGQKFVKLWGQKNFDIALNSTEAIVSVQMPQAFIDKYEFSAVGVYRPVVSSLNLTQAKIMADSIALVDVGVEPSAFSFDIKYTVELQNGVVGTLHYDITIHVVEK